VNSIINMFARELLTKDSGPTECSQLFNQIYTLLSCQRSTVPTKKRRSREAGRAKRKGILRALSTGALLGPFDSAPDGPNDCGVRLCLGTPLPDDKSHP
jgi:hypothetical protein